MCESFSTGRRVDAPFYPDDPRESVHVIRLEGEWDVSRGYELRRRLGAAVTHPRVVIEFSNGSFIDSYCAGILVRMRTQRVAKGYEPERLVVRAANVRSVLGVMGAHSLWRICDSLDDALKGWKHPGNIPAADAT